MPSTAMFHKLGTLGYTDVYLEKYSRSLVCLGGEWSQRLTSDCDCDVTVSDSFMSFLCKSRISRKFFCHVGEADLRKEPGIELTLITTDHCNFACSYCFANDLYTGSKTLNAENIVSYIKGFLNLSHARVSSLILFGGEPLLAFKAIKQAWKKIENLFADHQGDMPSIAIVTNGSLITYDIARFLADNDIAVTVSLDGPKVIHDACRPIRGGRASYEMVVEGIKELSRAGTFYAIEATYTSRHLELGIDVIDVVDHALGLNAQEVHVMPAFPEQASGINMSDNAYVAYLFMMAALRATSRYLTSGVVELAYASRLAYAFSHDRRRRYICTAGLDKFTIMANGDVVPCYLVCNSPYKIASCSESEKSMMKTPSFEGVALTYKALAREHLPECSRCWASDWCFACYGPGYARRSRLGAPGGLECDIYRAITEATLLECARFLTNPRIKTMGNNGGKNIF
jgi:uncharacterized protein